MPFDVVQHVTYVSVRYPSFMGSLGIPFYFGPVSGGEKVPPKLRKDFSVQERWRERLRDVSNCLVPFDPLLRQTFRRAERIIVTRDTVSLVPRSWRSQVRSPAGDRPHSRLPRPSDRGCAAQRPRRSYSLRRPIAGIERRGHRPACGLSAQTMANRMFASHRRRRASAEPSLRKLASSWELSGVVEWVGWLPRSAL